MLTILHGGKPADGVPHLTRAEAHALKRSAPLSHAQLKAHLRPAKEPPLRGA